MLLDSMTAISGKVNSASVCSMCAIPPRIEVDLCMFQRVLRWIL
jgi:hypothetical protein